VTRPGSRVPRWADYAIVSARHRPLVRGTDSFWTTAASRF
jgi:hypothetical protein